VPTGFSFFDRLIIRLSAGLLYVFHMTLEYNISQPFSWHDIVFVDS
jgi:hypothetical protein